MQRYDNSSLQSKFTANYFYKNFKYHGEEAGKQRNKKHGNIHKHDYARTVQAAIAHVQAMSLIENMPEANHAILPVSQKPYIITARLFQGTCSYAQRTSFSD